MQCRGETEVGIQKSNTRYHLKGIFCPWTWLLVLQLTTTCINQSLHASRSESKPRHNLIIYLRAPTDFVFAPVLLHFLATATATLMACKSWETCRLFNIVIKLPWALNLYLQQHSKKHIYFDAGGDIVVPFAKEMTMMMIMMLLSVCGIKLHIHAFINYWQHPYVLT